MALFENITKKVAETAKTAAKKSTELVEETKLKMTINSEESKIQKILQDMGRKLFESNKKGEPIDEKFTGQCEQIKVLYKSIEDMKNRILDLKNIRKCCGCGSEINTKAIFCPKCGVKQEAQAGAKPEPEGNVCPSCGNKNEKEATFCDSCGAKL